MWIQTQLLSRVQYFTFCPPFCGYKLYLKMETKSSSSLDDELFTEFGTIVAFMDGSP